VKFTSSALPAQATERVPGTRTKRKDKNNETITQYFTIRFCISLLFISELDISYSYFVTTQAGTVEQRHRGTKKKV
jgi:hypothetical protein